MDEMVSPLGKQAMIQQGYVPPTCILDDKVAGLLIWQEINAGRSPCWGCNHDRAICKGPPPRKSIINCPMHGRSLYREG